MRQNTSNKLPWALNYHIILKLNVFYLRQFCLLILFRSKPFVEMQSKLFFYYFQFLGMLPRSNYAQGNLSLYLVKIQLLYSFSIQYLNFSFS